MKSVETIKESIDSDDDTPADLSFFRRGNLRRSVSEELPTGQGNLLKGIDKKTSRRKGIWNVVYVRLTAIDNRSSCTRQVDNTL